MQENSRLARWIRNIVDIAVIVLIVVAAKTAIAEPFYVPSGSMEPTLLIGDELLATKFPYGYSAASLPSFLTVPNTPRVFATLPKRGDVVVFRWPGDRSQVWVKRVIGLPGDRIGLRHGQVWINGAPVECAPRRQRLRGSRGWQRHICGTLYRDVARMDTNTRSSRWLPTRQYDDMADIVVPAGQLFVMGDNRDNSADSRVPVHAGGVGLLPVEDLVGRVDAVVGSWDLAVKSRPLNEWPSGLRLSRFFTAVR